MYILLHLDPFYSKYERSKLSKLLCLSVKSTIFNETFFPLSVMGKCDVDEGYDY